MTPLQLQLGELSPQSERSDGPRLAPGQSRSRRREHRWFGLLLTEANVVTKEVPKASCTRAGILNSFQHAITGCCGPKRALLLGTPSPKWMLLVNFFPAV